MILFGTNPIAWTNDDDPSIGEHLTLDDCLSDCRKIGFDGIERGHKMPAEGAVLRAVLSDYGLRLAGVWHSTNLLVNELSCEKTALQMTIDLVKSAGGGHINACETSNSVQGRNDVSLNARPILDEAGWARFSAGYEALSAYAAAQGVAMGYHHHIGTIIESGADIDRFMAMAGPHTRLLLDTGHAYFGGVDPARLAARYMDRVSHIHCKNIRPEIMARVRAEGLSFLQAVRLGVFTVPGDAEGCIDFAPVLAVAATAHYRGWLVIEAEQDSAARDPFHYQNMGLAALRRMARDAGLTERGAARPSEEDL